MSAGELRTRRGALLVLVAVVLGSWIVLSEEAAWAVTSGAFIGLALAVWSLLAHMPSRRAEGDAEAGPAARREQRA